VNDRLTSQLLEDVRDKLDDFGRALGRLDAMMKAPAAYEGHVDAVIQRFEFCYELCWKSIRAVLKFQAVEINLPRPVFQKAFREGWIDDEAVFIKMMEDRNFTSHTYNAKAIEVIATRVPDYYRVMSQAHKKLVELLHGFEAEAGA
jgi:nucleotidyltransferase substrate binding protein (TIGR01987 family)